MTLATNEKSRGDLEYQKFLTDSSVAVNVNVLGGISLTAGDIEIGAVELKDGSSDNRATITSGALHTFDRVQNALVRDIYDYIGLSSGTTTDVWTYKNGGSTGSTVASVTITYTGSDKALISNVARS
jgi:hypothetical protein